MEYLDFEKDSDGVLYSIDMLRLELKFKSIETIQALVNRLQGYDNIGAVKLTHWDNYNYHKYRHLVKIEIEDGKSFSMGWNKEKDYTLGFVEFNPNKLGADDTFKGIYELIWRACKHINLKRYDLAIDLLAVDRWRAALVKDGRKYCYILDKSKTEYLGVRSTHNFVKLYDKQEESGLDFPLTRIEITLEPGKPIHYPTVRVKVAQDDLSSYLIEDDSLTKNDLVIYKLARLVENPFEILRELDRRKRKKIEELLNRDFELFKFNDSSRKSVLERVLKRYLK